MPAKSKSQQRFFGMVRAAQKGDLKDPSSEVADVADDISVKDAKKFAKTKHKGLPEKKAVKEGTSVINVNTSPKKVSYRGATKKSPHWTKFKPDEKTREHTKDLIQGKKPKKPKGKLRQKGDTWRASNYHVNFKHYKPDSKKKKMEEQQKINEDISSYKDFMKSVQAAKERKAKKQQTRKVKDAAYVDRLRKGIKFYDSKGSGRLVKGKKVYDK